MCTEKMREEFEAVLREDCEASGIDAPDLRVSPCILDDGAVIYINDMTQACWWSYRKGWQASRAAIEVELPEIVDKEWANTHAERSAMREAIGWCKKRIESLGLKVKP